MGLELIESKDDILSQIYSVLYVYKLQYYICECSELELECSPVSRDLCQHYLV